MKNLQDWRNLFTFATTYLPHFPLEQCAQGKFFFLYMYGKRLSFVGHFKALLGNSPHEMYLS